MNKTSEDEELQSLVKKLTAFEKMYQRMRVVDPVKKKVINYELGYFEEDIESCYNTWTHHEVCNNCISMRAYKENDTFIKIEYSENKIFMITAIPLELNKTKVVVELLKDVTNSMIENNTKLVDSINLKNLLDKANKAAVTDELTMVYNKRFIVERLPVEMVMFHLDDEPLSIVMADLDYFKKINDTYGHLAGDYILKGFSRILINNIRQEKDWVARFGGEEFLICLPNTNKTEAFIITERIRKAVEEEVFSYNNFQIKLTSSFGVFTAQNKEIIDYEKLVEYADKNLYRAKQAGRNIVIG